MKSGTSIRRWWGITTIVALLLACVAFSPQPASGLQAEIVQIGQQVTKDLVLIRFRVEGAFTPQITEAIQSGAPITFTYVIRLFRNVTSLPDERVFSYKLARTIRYDTLKQEYVISEKNNQWVASELKEAERLMTSVEDVAIALRSSLQPEETYYTLVKAELAEVELPFVISFLRFLVAPFDFETNWTRIDLTGWELKDE